MLPPTSTNHSTPPPYNPPAGGSHQRELEAPRWLPPPRGSGASDINNNITERGASNAPLANQSGRGHATPDLKGIQTTQTYTMAPADLEQYFDGFAQRLAHRPGAAHLSHPAKTAKAIPESILAHLTAKLSRRDPRAVASTPA